MPVILSFDMYIKRGNTAMEKVLEIIGLTKVYKNGRGIRNISLDINKGDVFGFLGPNGAGKTTAMKIMTGLSNFRNQK